LEWKNIKLTPWHWLCLA